MEDPTRCTPTVKMRVFSFWGDVAARSENDVWPPFVATFLAGLIAPRRSAVRTRLARR